MSRLSASGVASRPWLRSLIAGPASTPTQGRSRSMARTSRALRTRRAPCCGGHGSASCSGLSRVAAPGRRAEFMLPRGRGPDASERGARHSELLAEVGLAGTEPISRLNFRAADCRGWRLRAPSCIGRRSCWRMSRPAISTPTRPGSMLSLLAREIRTRVPPESLVTPLRGGRSPPPTAFCASTIAAAGAGTGRRLSAMLRSLLTTLALALPAVHPLRAIVQTIAVADRCCPWLCGSC